MTIYGRINSVNSQTIAGVVNLTIGLDVCLTNAGTDINDNTVVHVNGLDLATSLTIDAAVRSGLKSFISSKYGIDTSLADVKYPGFNVLLT